MSANAFRDALERGDLPFLRRYWAAIAPDFPQPESDEQAEIILHRARTEAEAVSFRARAYSHRWLTERSLPSGLPDHLRPKAERLEPIVVDAVGISVNASSPLLRPAAHEIQRSMETAVEECWADGRKDTPFVRARMDEARARTVQALFGSR